jgi:hypothetical protein
MKLIQVKNTMNLETITKNNGETMILLEDIARIVPIHFIILLIIKSKENVIKQKKQCARIKEEEKAMKSVNSGLYINRSCSFYYRIIYLIHLLECINFMF